MNSKERLLAIGVGAIFGALVLWYVTSSVLASYDAKGQRLAAAQKDLQKKQGELRETQQAATRLAQYETRSLPADPDLAKSLYTAWLNEVIDETGLSDVNLTASRATTMKNTYHKLEFIVKSKADLAQVTEFLYRFQERDWLHRLDKVTIKPIRDSKKLQFDFTINALSVNSASKDPQLPDRKLAALESIELAEYRDPILNRNFFGPPNSEPRLEVPTRSSATVGRSFEMTVKATDPDPLDRVTLKLVKNADPPARLDPQSGRFTWTPRRTGEFTFEIVAEDDGLPSKSKTQTVYISVRNPPPPPVERPRDPEPPKPRFDVAKYTVLTAVLAINDEAQVWLMVQPTGETRKLQVGDQFEIGSVKGEIMDIGLDDVILNVGGKIRRMGKGHTLFEAVSATN
jgi:hypothetical protein